MAAKIQFRGSEPQPSTVSRLPVGDTQNLLTAGPRDTVLARGFWLIEKLAELHRERSAKDSEAVGN